jgi:transposase-like protein
MNGKHSDAKFTCHICGKTYGYKNNLTEHMMVAHGIGQAKKFKMPHLIGYVGK